MGSQTTQGRVKCPVHKIPDCSPLLNGCSIITSWLPKQEARVRAEALREAADEMALSDETYWVRWLRARADAEECKP
jgi:hypothetical protein